MSIVACIVLAIVVSVSQNIGIKQGREAAEKERIEKEKEVKNDDKKRS